MVGIATLVSLRRVALALVVPILLILTMAASAMHRYPFLGLYELRTQLFWLVGVLILMAIGVTGIIRFLGRRHLVLGAVALVLISALWLREVAPDLRHRVLPQEPLRHHIDYLRAHQDPGDIVLLNFASAWGYAFYRGGTRFAIAKVANPPDGFPDFIPTFPRDRRVVVDPSGTDADIRFALATAERRAHQLGARRIWIVLSHIAPSERRAWRDALASSDVEIRRRDEQGQSLFLLHVTPAPAGTLAR
jgi:hypothetical protein